MIRRSRRSSQLDALIFSWPTLALLCACHGASAQSSAPEPVSLGAWHATAYEVDLQPSREGASVKFHSGVDWPNLILRGPAAGSASNTLLLPVSNTSEQVAEVFFRLGDDQDASWPEHAIAASIRLEPGQSTTILLPFEAHDPRSLGMQAGPPPIGTPAGPFSRLDLPTGHVTGAQVHTLVIALWGQSGPRQLAIGQPYFAQLDWSADGARGLIDRFGQSTRGDWPERVTSDEDLRQKALRRAPPLPAGAALDSYGGVIGRTDQPGSGFFRVSRLGPSSYGLFTPEGHRFFSLGVNAVARSEGATYVARREWMFRELPPLGPGLEQGTADDRSTNLAARRIEFDYGRWINFYQLNVERRFGPDSTEAWRADTVARLHAWGFNTLGNWSEPALRLGRGRLPYVVTIALAGEVGRITSPLDFWGAMLDPFDTRFQAVVEKSVHDATLESKDDQYVVGDFVENELPWGDGSDFRPKHRYSLALAAFGLGPTSAAKAALVAQLRAHYAGIEAFNRSWHLNVSSWDELVKHAPALPDTLSGEAQQDLKTFSAALAERYYSTVKAAISKEDPHHLYLGSRFAPITPEALAACARYCDVVSVNLYTAHMDLGRLDGVDKPVLISEFSFGAQDRGSFSGGNIDVASAAERARRYTSFVLAAARDSRVLGAHWFEYLDEPASGRRLDGENGNFGMVSIADVPFVTLVEAMQAANLQASSAALER
jgi:hypothetical protein